VEQWLKRMILGSPSTPKPQITPLGPVKKGKAYTNKILVKKVSPSTSRGDSDLGSRLEAIRERRKTLEKSTRRVLGLKAKAKVLVPLKVKAKALEKWNS